MFLSFYAVPVRSSAERKATANACPLSPFAPRKDALFIPCCSDAILRGAKGDNEPLPIVFRSAKGCLSTSKKSGSVTAGPPVAETRAGDAAWTTPLSPFTRGGNVMVPPSVDPAGAGVEEDEPCAALSSLPTACRAALLTDRSAAPKPKPTYPPRR